MIELPGFERKVSDGKLIADVDIGRIIEQRISLA